MHKWFQYILLVALWVMCYVLFLMNKISPDTTVLATMMLYLGGVVMSKE